MFIFLIIINGRNNYIFLNILQLNTQIHNLITNGKVTLVVFKSGAVHELANVIEQRKKFTPEQIVNNDIKNIIYKDFDDKFYVGISVEGDDSFYWTVYNSECMKFTKIQLSRNGHSLKGTCFHQEKGKPVLLTICKYMTAVNYFF